MSKAQLDATRTERKVRARIPSPHSARREVKEDLELDTMVAELRAELAHLQELATRAREVKSKYAHACAAIAQTDTEYFRIMCKLLDPLVQSFPDHPLVQQWRAVRGLWHEQLLKQN